MDSQAFNQSIGRSVFLSFNMTFVLARCLAGHPGICHDIHPSSPHTCLYDQLFCQYQHFLRQGTQLPSRQMINPVAPLPSLELSLPRRCCQSNYLHRTLGHKTPCPNTHSNLLHAHHHQPQFAKNNAAAPPSSNALSNAPPVNARQENLQRRPPESSRNLSFGLINSDDFRNGQRNLTLIPSRATQIGKNWRICLLGRYKALGRKMVPFGYVTTQFLWQLISGKHRGSISPLLNKIFEEKPTFSLAQTP